MSQEKQFFLLRFHSSSTKLWLPKRNRVWSSGVLTPLIVDLLLFPMLDWTHCIVNDSTPRLRFDFASALLLAWLMNSFLISCFALSEFFSLSCISSLSLPGFMNSTSLPLLGGWWSLLFDCLSLVGWLASSGGLLKYPHSRFHSIALVEVLVEWMT